MQIIKSRHGAILFFAMKIICLIINFCSETFQKLTLITKNYFFLKTSSVIWLSRHLKFIIKKDHKFENLTEDEHQVFLELIELDNVVIQKADKGNVIVIIKKNDYVGKLETILNK